MVEISQPFSRPTGAQTASSIASRSSTENNGALPGWVPIASTSLSASPAA